LITLVHSLKHSSAPLGPSIHFSKIDLLKNGITARCWWLTPIILATQEDQIIHAIVCITKNPSQEKGWWNGSNGSYLPNKYEAPSLNPSVANK
jgi:hypothetical protein